ncbi:MAG: Hsp33 family molecular chaperone HslO, partial [Gammaproteobacteria bacterium]|nr:Hsp33 family molecular chaperone HslO [Gammaproteobacteria bacterium]
RQGERYQSIVPIEQATLAGCLEDYFARSEQLPSWFVLCAQRDTAVGVALHALPAQRQPDKKQSLEDFARLQALLHSATDVEALELPAEDLLTRLFHQEQCRLFEPQAVEFGCVCSAEKSLAAIQSLGREDVDHLIAEQRKLGNNGLVVDCHFCFQRYQFDYEDVESALR